MPYDPSGNFTRDYDWTNDRNNGVKVRADRMDGEFNNFATAMNQVMLRNGVAAFTGNANMGGNSIVALADGTVGTPAIRFLGSPTTGVFSPGMDKVALTASGTNRVEANSTGALVNGTLGVSGALSVAGATTYSGDTTFLGNVGIGGVPVAGTASKLQSTGDITLNGAVGLNSYFSSGAYRAYTTGYSGFITLNSANGAITFGTTPTSSAAGVASGAVERARIDANGNFGVGATTLVNTPNYGGITLNGPNGSVFSQMIGGLERGRMAVDASGLSFATLAALPMLLITNNAERVRIDANGYLGIGTPAPQTPAGHGSYTLNGQFGGLAYFSANGVITGRLYGSSGAFEVATPGAYPLIFATNGGERMRIAASGEVYLNQSQSPTTDKAIGYLGIPATAINSVSNYTFTLADAGQHRSFNAGVTATIPANAAVPYPVGTTLTIVNRNAAPVSITINTDLMILGGTTSTGARSLAQNGVATALKVTGTEWIISGPGLS